MPQHPSTSSLRLKRLAWLAMLVVVVRVVGWELHMAVEQHWVGETCQVCLVAERSGDALAAACGLPLSLPVAPLPRVEFAPLLAARAAPCPLPRGPPSFHG